ncbi:MAG: HDOD domain-containing protein [Vicinamibacterales bacterium]
MPATLPLLPRLIAFADARGISLPVFDETAIRLRQEARREHVNAAAIAREIESDPTMAAEVLSVANSAFFAGHGEVTSIQTALLRLGVPRVTNLVLLATERDRYRARHPLIARLMRRLWTHAASTALGAEWIARRQGLADEADEAFMGGLIHDIGKLYLLRVLDEMHRIDPEDLTADFSAQLLDGAHAEQGYRQLASWNLPALYLTIVRDHHAEHPDLDNGVLLSVRLANLACRKVGLGLAHDPGLALHETTEAVALGVSEVAAAELEDLLQDGGPLAA